MKGIVAPEPRTLGKPAAKAPACQLCAQTPWKWTLHFLADIDYSLLEIRTKTTDLPTPEFWNQRNGVKSAGRGGSPVIPASQETEAVLQVHPILGTLMKTLS